jgi:hypothetical protein
MEQVNTNAWKMVNDAINFGMERWITDTEELIHRINLFIGVTEREEQNEIIDREHRLGEIIMLGILEKSLPANSLEFYARNDATKRLINKGIISRKVRGGWKINRKRDPR